MLACALGAALALGSALAIAGFGVLRAVHQTLGIVSGDHAEPLQAADFGAALLVGIGLLLAVGAVALAVAGRRAALALERISLIERVG